MRGTEKDSILLHAGGDLIKSDSDLLSQILFHQVWIMQSRTLSGTGRDRTPSEALPQRHQQERKENIRKDYLKVHMIESPQIVIEDEDKGKGKTIRLIGLIASSYELYERQIVYSYCVNCTRNTNMNISMMRMLLGHGIYAKDIKGA